MLYELVMCIQILSVGVCVLRENQQKEDHKEGAHSSWHTKLRIIACFVRDSELLPYEKKTMSI